MDYTLVLAILSSSVVATIVNFVLDKLRANDKNAEGIKCLLGFEIRHECEKLIKEGNVNLEELRQLNELYKAYKSLEGNGFITDLYDKVCKLPVE